MGAACPAFSAAEAERWGLVNKVVPLDRLEQETAEIAYELAGGPRLVLGYTKVGGRAWMADAAGNRVPAPGTGGLSFAAN